MNRILTKFFTKGQVIETDRWGGIFQPAIKACSERLGKGDWVRTHTRAGRRAHPSRLTPHAARRTGPRLPRRQVQSGISQSGVRGGPVVPVQVGRVSRAIFRPYYRSRNGRLSVILGQLSNLSQLACASKNSPHAHRWSVYLQSLSLSPCFSRSPFHLLTSLIQASTSSTLNHVPPVSYLTRRPEGRSKLPSVATSTQWHFLVCPPSLSHTHTHTHPFRSKTRSAQPASFHFRLGRMALPRQGRLHPRRWRWT